MMSLAVLSFPITGVLISLNLFKLTIDINILSPERFDYIEHSSCQLNVKMFAGCYLEANANIFSCN